MPAPNPQKRQPRDHQELPRNNIDSNCSKDLQPDAPKQNKTQTRPSLEKKPKRVPHKPINLRTKNSPSDVSWRALNQKTFKLLSCSSNFQKPLIRSTAER